MPSGGHRNESRVGVTDPLAVLLAVGLALSVLVHHHLPPLALDGCAVAVSQVRREQSPLGQGARNVVGDAIPLWDAIVQFMVIMTGKNRSPNWVGNPNVGKSSIQTLT